MIARPAWHLAPGPLRQWIARRGARISYGPAFTDERAGEVARENDRPVPGAVLLAGTVDHLALKSPDRLGYTSEPQHSIYRPSIDVFFHSVSARWRGGPSPPEPRRQCEYQQN